MSFRCADLLKIPFFSKSELLAGHNHLSAEICWYHILDMSAGESHGIVDANSGDMLLITDYTAETMGSRLTDIVTESSHCGLPCIIIFSNGEQDDIPMSAISAAQKENLPLFLIKNRELPVGIMVREILLFVLKDSGDQQSLNNIFNSIALGKEKSESEFQLMMRFCDYDFERYHQAVCISYKAPQNRLLAEHGLTSVFRDFLCEIYGKNVLCGVVNGDFLALLPDQDRKNDLVQIGEHMMRLAYEAYRGVRFFCGIGNAKCKIEEFSESIHEAMQITRALKIFNRERCVKTFYEMIPFVLLLEVRDRKQLYRLRNPIIAPLYSLRAENGASNRDLADTLEMYFQCGKNAKLTAEKMFIHRNTLNMRLRKIEDLCGVDLSDSEKCFELQFAVYVEKCLMLG